MRRLWQSFGLGLVIISLAQVSYANQTESIEFDFDEDSVTRPSLHWKVEPQDTPFWEISGSVKSVTHYSIAQPAPTGNHRDRRGLSQAKLQATINLDWHLMETLKATLGTVGFIDTIYPLNYKHSTEIVPIDELKNYESEWELGEAYLSWTMNETWSLKAGRQILSWGMSDYVQVIDRINPLDQRWPGLADVETLKLPIGLIQLLWAKGNWRWEALAIYERQWPKMPVPDQDFYTPKGASPKETMPGQALSDLEFGMALIGYFSGWDGGLYITSLFEDQAVFQLVNETLIRGHPRVLTLGGSGNLAWNNWVFRGELAWRQGHLEVRMPHQNLQVIESIGGLDYSGFSGATIGLEVKARKALNFSDQTQILSSSMQSSLHDLPSNAALRMQWSAVYRQSLLQNHVHFLALGSFFGTTFEEGNMLRTSLTWNWRDNKDITIGWIGFQPGTDARWALYDKNDRVWCTFTYFF